MLKEEAAASAELIPNQSEAEHPAAKCVFLVGARDLPRACPLLAKGLLCKRKAELDVAFDLACMECAVKEAELNCSLGKEGVKVEPAIAAVIVVTVVGVRGSIIVPDHSERFSRLRFLFVQLFQIRFGGLLTVIDVTVFRIDLKGFVDHVLIIGEEIRKISQCRWCELLCADVDVHSAAAVDLCACVPQVTHYLLQIFDVTVVEDRRYKLHLVVFSCADYPLPLRMDAAVSHNRPLAPAGVSYNALVVTSPLIPDCRSKEFSDHLCRLLSRDARELEFAPEG